MAGSMNRGDLTIDRLNLRLPASLGKRADRIARDAVRQLRRLRIDRSLALTTLDIAPIQIGGGETDAVIAGRIADGIGRALHLYQRGHQRGDQSSPGPGDVITTLPGRSLSGAVAASATGVTSTATGGPAVTGGDSSDLV